MRVGGNSGFLFFGTILYCEYLQKNARVWLSGASRNEEKGGLHRGDRKPYPGKARKPDCVMMGIGMAAQPSERTSSGRGPSASPRPCPIPSHRKDRHARFFLFMLGSLLNFFRAGFVIRHVSKGTL